MNAEAIALTQLPRRYAIVALELSAARAVYDRWLKLATEFINCDPRPILVVDGVVQPRDMSIVPNEIRQAMTTESQRIAGLERELHEAYRANRI